jgi:hypothetical protein
MNKGAAFLQLIRWPNLLFIALTQVLFQYCLLHSGFEKSKTTPTYWQHAPFLCLLRHQFLLPLPVISSTIISTSTLIRSTSRTGRLFQIGNPSLGYTVAFRAFVYRRGA